MGRMIYPLCQSREPKKQVRKIPRHPLQPGRTLNGIAQARGTLTIAKFVISATGILEIFWISALINCKLKTNCQ
jgi:hypothetical protein